MKVRIQGEVIMEIDQVHDITPEEYEALKKSLADGEVGLVENLIDFRDFDGQRVCADDIDLSIVPAKKGEAS